MSNLERVFYNFQAMMDAHCMPRMATHAIEAAIALIVLFSALKVAQLLLFAVEESPMFAFFTAAVIIAVVYVACG